MRASTFFGLLSSSFSLSSVCALSLIAACSAAPGDESAQSESAAVSSATPTLFTLAPSTRGGFEVTSLNTSAASHVGSVDYTSSGVDSDAMSTLPSTELVLAGAIESGTFVVTTAYRGMPGMTFDSSATFYQASGSTAQALNENVTRRFESIDVSAASAPLVSQAWLANEVTKGALVAGKVTEGARVLTAQQVFIALPFIGGPCLVTEHVCPDATPVNTFTRDANLCLDFAGCEADGICAKYIPSCSTGYSLETWAGGPQSCPQFACDPSFIHESN